MSIIQYEIISSDQPAVELLLRSTGFLPKNSLATMHWGTSLSAVIAMQRMQCIVI